MNVLDYHASATLPLGCEEDVCKYLQVFRNPGTSGNYQAHLRWACKAYGKGTTWSGDELAVVLKGIKKVDLRTHLSQMPEKLRGDRDGAHGLPCSRIGGLGFFNSDLPGLSLPAQGAKRLLAWRSAPRATAIDSSQKRDTPQYGCKIIVLM